MVSGRHAAWVLSLVVVLAGASGCAADPTTEEGLDPSSEEAELKGKTYDIPLSEKLLAEAEAIAAKRQSGKHVCDDGTYLSDISNRVRLAIAVRDTVFFRTRVLAKKAGIARELAGTLDWQEFMGVYDPKKPQTLAAALANGVNLWDTNGGAYGNQIRIEFQANGRALWHQLDTESTDFHWNTTKTRWSLVGDQLTVANRTYRVATEAGTLVLFNARGAFEFVDSQSECEA